MKSDPTVVSKMYYKSATRVLWHLEPTDHRSPTFLFRCPGQPESLQPQSSFNLALSHLADSSPILSVARFCQLCLLEGPTDQ